MKKLISFSATVIAASIFVFSCGSKPGSTEKTASAETTTATEKTTQTAPEAAETVETAVPPATVFAAGSRPPRGSKIYIAPAGKANKVGAHLSNAIQAAGYWTQVGSKSDADFILQPVVDEKGMSISGYVVLKNLDGSSIMQSPKFKAISFAGNGFSAWRGFGTQVGKWLKSGQ